MLCRWFSGIKGTGGTVLALSLGRSPVIEIVLRSSYPIRDHIKGDCNGRLTCYLGFDDLSLTISLDRRTEIDVALRVSYLASGQIDGDCNCRPSCYLGSGPCCSWHRLRCCP